MQMVNHENPFALPLLSFVSYLVFLNDWVEEKD